MKIRSIFAGLMFVVAVIVMRSSIYGDIAGWFRDTLSKGQTNISINTNINEYQYKDIIKKEYPFVADGMLSLHGKHGNVLVVATNDTMIQLEATRFATSAENLAKIEIVADVKDGKADIQTVYQEDFLKARVQYVLKVPAHTQLSLVHDFGPIGVSGMKNSVSITNNSGKVEMIQAELHAKESINVQVGAGDAVLRLPAMLNADLKAKTDSGTITLAHPVTATIQTANQIEGTIGNGGAQIAVTVGAGNIIFQKGS